MSEWNAGQIVERRQWAENLYSLYIDAPLPEFRAGQYVKIALDVGPQRVVRPYSLVNAPDERPLEIYFTEVPEGPLSPRLSALAIGARVWVAARAGGIFTLEQVVTRRHLWLLATGTALGVYLSILKTNEPWARFERVMLVHGVRYPDELSYRETIAALSARHGTQLIFIPTLTRAECPGILHGRITELLASGALQAAAGAEINPEDSHLMLCGNAQMIREVSAWLEARGLRRHKRNVPGHYTTEQYG